MTAQSASDVPTRLTSNEAPQIAPSIRRSLGQHLRETYASLEDEQPDRFDVLLARLEAVLAATGGRGADSVIDAVALDATLDDAFGAVRTGGTVSVIGVHDLEPYPLPILGALFRSVTLAMTTAPVHRTWAELVPLVQSGRLDTSGLFTHSFALDDAARAALLATAGERLGIALAPVVAALDLAEVVLAGPSDLLNGELASAVATTLRDRTLQQCEPQLLVRLSEDPQDIVLRGTAVLVLWAQLGVA